MPPRPSHLPVRPAPARARLVLLALAATGAGCPGKTLPPPAGPVALFQPPAPGEASELRALPWPNDLYRDGGRVHLATFAPLQATAAQALARDDLAARGGFGVSSGAFFPVSDQVDAASLAGRVRLVDLDAPGCPAPEIPVEAGFRAEDQLIHARPEGGHVLLQRRRYAWLLQAGITAAGRAIGPSPAFAAVRDAKARPSDPALARAWDVLAPLRAREGCGVRGSDLIAAAVFTTQPVTAVLDGARALVRAGPPPAARVASIWAASPTKSDDGGLDDLLGAPSSRRPGLDNPLGPAHDAIAFIVQGDFEAPDLLAPSAPSPDPRRATASALGSITLDRDGAPSARGRASVPFTLIVPRAPGLANVPVVLFAHGLAADRSAALGVADTFARAGLATLAIDLPFHGARHPRAVDERRNFAGTAGPDGFAEAADDATPLFFDLAGDPARDMAPLDPAVLRGSLQQAAADLIAATYLLTDGSFAALGAREARLAAFSPRRGDVVIAGESLGAMTSLLALAAEPRLAAGVLVVGGGGIAIPITTWSPSFASLLGGPVERALGVLPALAPPESDFGYNLLQLLLEGGDPIAVAPYVIAHPPAGAAPRHVLLLSARDDELLPNVATSALSRALGLAEASAGPATPDAPAPIAGNLGAGDHRVTGVHVRFDGATHGMLTLQRDIRLWDPAKRPFRRLPDLVSVDNPIEAVQGLAAAFAADVYAGRTPSVSTAIGRR